MQSQVSLIEEERIGRENQRSGSMRKTQRAFAGFGNGGRGLGERVASKR